MKKRNVIWLSAAVFAALVCAAVRVWQCRAAFEGPYGLPIPMAPPSVILLALLVIAAASLVLAARNQPVDGKVRKNPHLALYAPGDTVFLFIMVLAAFLTLLAAPFFLMDGWQYWSDYQAIKQAAFMDGSVPGGNNGILMLVAGVTSLFAFFGIVMTTKASIRGIPKGRMGILASVINSCLWLMELYRGHAAEPVRWSYAPMLVSVVFGILFYLNCAGLFTGTAAPRRTLWLAAMTVVTSAVALAGKWDVSSAALLAAQIFAALAVLWRVPNNLAYPPEFSAEEVRSEEKLEEDTHE